jgi:hypothetical protein
VSLSGRIAPPDDSTPGLMPDINTLFYERLKHALHCPLLQCPLNAA